MPILSKAQGRLMQAAAHTPGGYGGVPQSVGKKFVAAGPVSSKLTNHVKRAPGELSHHQFHKLGSVKGL